MRIFSAAWVLLAALATRTINPARADAASAWIAEQLAHLTKTQGQYSNRQYGLRLSIPSQVGAWTTTPPNPDHGVLLILGDHRTIEISASYDAALYGSTTSLMDRRLGDFRGSVQRTATHLGGLPAEQAVVTATPPETIVAQWLSISPQNAINYTIILVTTPASRQADNQILAATLARYRHMPPER